MLLRSNHNFKNETKNTDLRLAIISSFFREKEAGNYVLQVELTTMIQIYTDFSPTESTPCGKNRLTELTQSWKSVCLNVQFIKRPLVAGSKSESIAIKTEFKMHNFTSSSKTL